jgi:hypothetical protein
VAGQRHQHLVGRRKGQGPPPENDPRASFVVAEQVCRCAGSRSGRVTLSTVASMTSSGARQPADDPAGADAFAARYAEPNMVIRLVPERIAPGFRD